MKWILTPEEIGQGDRHRVGVFDRAPENGEVYCDISDPASVSALPKGPYGAVINAAGIVDQSVRASVMSAVNTAGAGNLARWARVTGCGHFIHLSSIAVYGLMTLGQGRTENHAWKLWKYLGIPYMRTKARAEEVVRNENRAFIAADNPNIRFVAFP